MVKSNGRTTLIFFRYGRYTLCFSILVIGKFTNFELAEKVGLSPSPCLRRVKTLELKGLIAGYTAIIDEIAYGYPVTAFVSVRLENQTDQILKSFVHQLVSYFFQ